MTDTKDGGKDNLPLHLRNAPSKFNFLNKAYEPEPDPNAPKHLGMMNSWPKDEKEWPEEYVACQRGIVPHELTVTDLGKRANRGYCSYKCSICNIEWTVDSTD